MRLIENILLVARRRVAEGEIVLYSDLDRESALANAAFYARAEAGAAIAHIGNICCDALPETMLGENLGRPSDDCE